MDISTPRRLIVGNRKFTLNRTSPIVLGIQESCHWNAHPGREQLVWHCLVLPPRYLLGRREWDPVVVWHKYLATAYTWELGCYSLGTRRICPTVTQTANPSLLEGESTFCFPLVQSFDCTPTGVEDISAYIEVLTESTQQALNGRQQSLSFLNTELSRRRKALLQIRVVLDVFLSCAEALEPLSRQNVCGPPDEFAHASPLVSHTRAQMNTPSDLTSSLGELTTQ